MKILITSGAWQASLACIQSLGRAGHEVYLIDQDPNLAVAHSKYCRGQILSPSEKDEAPYTNFLLDFVKKNHFDVLIPISDYCAQYCAKNQAALKQYVRLLLPPAEVLAIAANKTKTYAFAIEHKIAIPKTYFPSDLKEAQELSKEKIYPAMVKIPNSRASKGVFRVNSQQELVDLFRANPFEGQWPVIQEYVEGEFFGFTAIACEGRILGHCTFKTHAQFLQGGTPPVIFSVVDPILLEQAQNLIAKLHWTGAIDLDYFKVKNRGYVLLEINPRFSGSLNFAYRLGVDLPLMYYRLAMEGQKAGLKQHPYKNNVMFRTIFPTEIIRCHTNPQYKWTFLKNFFNLNSKSNIYWDDPRLTWWQMKETRWWCQDIKRARVKTGLKSHLNTEPQLLKAKESL